MIVIDASAAVDLLVGTERASGIARVLARCSVYDACYVALAESLGAELLTREGDCAI